MPRQAYDIVIVGGGPAGLAAGLYAARARRKTVLLEKGIIGGQITLTELVENYPGVPSVNGFDLAQTMLKQAESYGLETQFAAVTALEQEGKRWLVRTAEDEYAGKAVIVTAGDARQNAARQVVSSAGDGATAVIAAEHYLGSSFAAEE